MTHLSPQELTAWFEEGRAADRERVIGHLAECDACRQSLAMLAKSADLETAAPIVDPADVRARGYAAMNPRPAEGGWLARLRPVYALAAAAVVILGVLWVTTPRSTEPADVMRGSELMALSPSGATNSLEFRWASPLAAPRYRLVIRDASGTLVYSGESTTASHTIEPAARGKFATMVEYAWTVSALDAAGDVIAESKPQGVLYQP